MNFKVDPIMTDEERQKEHSILLGEAVAFVLLAVIIQIIGFALAFAAGKWVAAFLLLALSLAPWLYGRYKFWLSERLKDE